MVTTGLKVKVERTILKLIADERPGNFNFVVSLLLENSKTLKMREKQPVY
jgi:hypothetical protein